METLEPEAGKKWFYLAFKDELWSPVLKILNISNLCRPAQTRRALLDSLRAAIKQQRTTLV